MSNTFERLRDAASYEFTPHAVASLYTKAADEIDRLTAESEAQESLISDLRSQLAEAKEIIKELEGRNGRIGT